MKTSLKTAGLGLWIALLGLTACVGAAKPPPDSATIESLGILASQAGQAEAKQQLRHWAEQGLPIAQRELARSLLRGDSEAQQQGLDWLGRAALGGDAEAAYLQGEGLRLGRYGQRPDVTAAKPWLERAAELRHADAALALARLARNGEAGPRDAAAALRWLQLAAQGGNAQAMLLLSNAYAQGQGTVVDWRQARHWLEQAADRHFPAAIQAYALALENGELGLDKDPAQARELLMEASEERRNRWNTR